jgi:hypothetical protein
MSWSSVSYVGIVCVVARLLRAIRRRAGAGLAQGELRGADVAEGAGAPAACAPSLRAAVFISEYEGCSV